MRKKKIQNRLQQREEEKKRKEEEREQQRQAEQELPSTWFCTENCDINVENIYNRFYTIIEVVLASTAAELITFIDNVDKCDHRDLADVRKLGHPKECSIHRENNYGCSSVLLFLRSVAPPLSVHEKHCVCCLQSTTAIAKN